MEWLRTMIDGWRAMTMGQRVGWPVRHPVVTSPWGPRVLNGQAQNHTGVDFVEGATDAARPRIVCAIAPGEVVYDKDNYDDAKWRAMMDAGNITSWADSGGNMVIIRSSFAGLPDVFVRYLHLRTNAVSVGQRVEAGEEIGQYDNVGYSYGAHLHIDMMPLDWSGFIDPRPYFAAAGYII